MEQPLVSVIIPNYNYGRYLRQTLDSVLAQTYTHLEIIVVDDGSKDESEAVVASYGERVRFLKQKNQGVSAARNNGVKESSGELIAFLDADDVWLPLKLEKQVRILIDDPEIGLVHCGVEEIDVAGNRLEKFVEGMEGWVSTEMLLFERPVVLATGSTGLIPRATFEAVGGFDSRLCTSADWDFCYRISRRQRVGFVPEALVLYRVHGSNMHANIHLMEHDMLLGYEKAFSVNDPDIQVIRRRSYSNAHMVLAGCYFWTGSYYECVRHAATSLVYSPRNVSRILGFPKRWWRRRVGIEVFLPLQTAETKKSEQTIPLSQDERALSVIVPVKDEESSVEALIVGLQKQSYPPREIVITDGGSRDKTVEIIRRLQSTSDIPIVLVEDAHAFPGRGRNLAIKNASYDWLACVDAGIVPESDWVEKLVAASMKHPAAQLIQGRVKPVIGTYFDECAAVSYVPPPWSITPFIASCMVHRSAFDLVGGFPEHLRSSEDLVFFRKLKAANVQRGIAADAWVRWTIQPDTASTFRRFSTYSRYAMKAGLGADWQLRVSFLYLSFLFFISASIFWWPILLVPLAALILRAQKRIYHWYRAKGKFRQIVEVLNPLRVLTVTWISVVIDLAMFLGLYRFFKLDLLGNRKLSEQQPKEVGL